jgi:hypothetical protein
MVGSLIGNGRELDWKSLGNAGELLTFESFNLQMLSKIK